MNFSQFFIKFQSINLFFKYFFKFKLKQIKEIIKNNFSGSYIQVKNIVDFNAFFVRHEIGLKKFSLKWFLLQNHPQISISTKTNIMIDNNAKKNLQHYKLRNKIK